MPIRDCMTSSPYCPADKYEEFHDPVLSKENITAKENDSKQSWTSKHHLGRKSSGHNGRFGQFADNVHALKNKVTHH